MDESVSSGSVRPAGWVGVLRFMVGVGGSRGGTS